jgi:hypothetical protein
MDSPTRRLTFLPPYNEGDSFSHLSDIDSESVTAPPPTSLPRWTEHRYTKSKGGRTWLTFVLISKANKPEELPYFFGYAPITGRVEFDLTNPEYISGVTLEVSMTVLVYTNFVTHMYGKIEGRSANTATRAKRRSDEDMDRATKFLSMSHIIWKSNRKISFTDRLLKREGDLICGQCALDFSFQLPLFVRSKHGPLTGLEKFALPSSYAEQKSRVGITYAMTLVIQRGSMAVNDRQALCIHVLQELRIEFRISRYFAWQPVVQPPAMSKARRNAYINGSASIPGVTQDPEGWHTLEPILISGKIFGQTYIEAEYTVGVQFSSSYSILTALYQLSLAKPVRFLLCTSPSQNSLIIISAILYSRFDYTCQFTCPVQ